MYIGTIHNLVNIYIKHYPLFGFNLVHTFFNDNLSSLPDKTIILNVLFYRLTGRIKRSDIEEIDNKHQKLVTIDTLAALEPEDCFKRLFCSAATER